MNAIICHIFSPQVFDDFNLLLELFHGEMDKFLQVSKGLNCQIVSLGSYWSDSMARLLTTLIDPVCIITSSIEAVIKCKINLVLHQSSSCCSAIQSVILFRVNFRKFSPHPNLKKMPCLILLKVTKVFSYVLQLRMRQLKYLRYVIQMTCMGYVIQLTYMGYVIHVETLTLIVSSAV